MELAPTCDPFVFIEEQRDGYIRYRNTEGRRWEVIGTCNQCGKCWEGAVSPKPELDCPVTPEFVKVCDVFSYVELERYNGD